MYDSQSIQLDVSKKRYFRIGHEFALVPAGQITHTSGKE